MVLTLWNEDMDATKNLDYKRSYYKMSIQDATTSIYSQQASINTNKASVIKVLRKPRTFKNKKKLKLITYRLTKWNWTRVKRTLYSTGNRGKKKQTTGKEHAMTAPVALWVMMARTKKRLGMSKSARQSPPIQSSLVKQLKKEKNENRKRRNESN